MHSRSLLTKALYGVLMVLIFTCATTALAQDPLRIVIDEPREDIIAKGSVRVAGWAVDPSAGEQNGPGIDQIRIYAGADCSGELLAETVTTIPRADVVQALALDDSYTNSGFAVDLDELQEGTFTLTVCAYAANTVSAQTTRTISVAADRSQPNPVTSKAVFLSLGVFVFAFGLLFWAVERTKPWGSGLLSRRWIRAAVVIASLTPLAIVLIQIQRYGVNVPFWDEWDLLVQPYLGVSGNQLAELWQLSNEHRLFVPRLVAMAIASLTNLDMLAQVYFNVVLTVLICLVVYAIYRHMAESGSRYLVILPTAFLLFTMGLWPRWVDTRPMYLLIAALASLAALWVIVTQPAGWRGLLFAGGFGWLASLSFFTGHFTWIIVGGLLWFRGYRKLRYYFVWGVMAAVVLVPYVLDYSTASSIARSSAYFNLEGLVNFIVIFVGSAIAPDKPLQLPQDESFWLGVTGLVSVCVLSISNVLFVRNGFQKSLPWLAIIVWVLANAVFAGVGRIEVFGINSARAIRYMLYGNLFWIAVINLGLITLTEPRKSPKSDRAQKIHRLRYAVSTLAVVVMLVIGIQYAIVQQTTYQDDFLARVEQLRRGHACLLDYAQASDDCLINLYPDPDKVRDLAPLLEQHNVTFMRRETTKHISVEELVAVQ